MSPNAERSSLQRTENQVVHLEKTYDGTLHCSSARVLDVLPLVSHFLMLNYGTAPNCA